MKKISLLLVAILTLSTAGNFDKLSLECDAYRLASKYNLEKAVEAGNVNLWDIVINDLDESNKFLQELISKCTLTDSEKTELNKMAQGIQGLRLIAEASQKKKVISVK